MSLSPYVLHWNGADWQRSENVPMPGDSIEFHALLPLAADDVYAGGSWVDGGVGYGPMVTYVDGSGLALGNPSVYWNGSEWLPQPALPDFDAYGWSSLQATGPCNAVGAAVVDIVGARRSIAIELKPIVYRNGFD